MGTLLDVHVDEWFVQHVPHQLLMGQFWGEKHIFKNKMKNDTVVPVPKDLENSELMLNSLIISYVSPKETIYWNSYSNTHLLSVQVTFVVINMYESR